jgi:hypothetical protein
MNRVDFIYYAINQDRREGELNLKKWYYISTLINMGLLHSSHGNWRFHSHFLQIFSPPFNGDIITFRQTTCDLYLLTVASSCYKLISYFQVNPKNTHVGRYFISAAANLYANLND